MNILVLGGGGREHAISWALAKSPRCTELYVAPGNGGTANIARNVKDLNAEDAQAVLAFAQAHNIELVVIGPEAPLVAGVADVLREAGIPVFGPDAQGAQLEGSKTYSKRFMDANGIPTARYQSFTDAASARAYCEELGAPLVVKADGLAAGKGVVVAETLALSVIFIPYWQTDMLEKEHNPQYISTSQSLVKKLDIETSKTDRIKTVGTTLNCNYGTIMQRATLADWTHLIPVSYTHLTLPTT